MKLVQSGAQVLRCRAIIPYTASATGRTTGSVKRHLSSGGKDTLVGTVPPHDCYVLLYHHIPPTKLPSRPDSPIIKTLRQHVASIGGLVNFAWREDIQPTPSISLEEAYSATAFYSWGGRLDIPNITEVNVDECAEALTKFREREAQETPTKEIHLYVCTHGARDCRCGESGVAVATALRTELAQLQETAETRDEWVTSPKDIKIGEVTHVGGHKYAGNVLVFPHGDWLGLMQPGDARPLLRSLMTERTPTSSLGARIPLLADHWRGRMGMTPARQEVILADFLRERQAGSST